jgi:hypothetical protein
MEQKSSPLTDDQIAPIAVPASRYRVAPDVAVVSCYFNSHNYNSKRHVFQQFRNSMEESGVPLFIGECAFGEQPFELPPSSTVFQFRARDVMWQKERLLNLTIDRVPDRYTKIAWIDADILFTNPNWLTDASERLDQYSVVQLFSHVLRLRPNETSYFGGGDRAHGFGFAYTALPAFSRLPFSVHGRTGYGWAADRQLLTDVGLYDAAIMGGGDHLAAHAFTGAFSSCLTGHFPSNSGYLDHFRGWAEALWSVALGRLGYVPGAALHLWHGERRNRRYAGRLRELSQLGYDPKVHLQAAPGGVWTWSDEGAFLAAWASAYFRDRHEDTTGHHPDR